MKSALVILAVIIASFSLVFGNSCLQEKSYPEEYRLNVSHVSDQQESEKYGPRVGRHCHLACATMLMKYFDPTIEFWEALVFKEGTTSFSFYFCGYSNTETAAGLHNGGTDSLFLLAKELGIEVIRGNYARYDLYTTDEIFCTCNSPILPGRECMYSSVLPPVF